MYLKSVEIHGFKSFANKMVLGFGNGITGIVGPNGSGKSNVADAVRWVLGEQSAKQLRGAKMEDVIFAGTELKKAQSFAYVAITLDNGDHMLPIDYEEVTVARRVYRSGESEYLINGSGCRLKDVQELFLDTGIGKEGYSIIGQGQIEKIIGGRPEDRRELFDEAAGITKFKKRKAEAVKNLNEETTNLERVTDIMGELERQVGPLSAQAETAKKFLAFRDELRNYEIMNFLGEYDRTEEMRTKAERDKTVAESSLLSAETRLLELRVFDAETEDALRKKSVEVEETSALISDYRIEREKLDGEIRVIEEQINSAKVNNETFGERIENEENRLRILVKEEEEARLKIEALKKKTETYELRVEESELLLTAEKKKNEELVKERERRLKEGIRLEKEKAEAGGRIELHKAGLEQLNIKRLEINGKILRNKENADLIEGKIAEADNEIETLSAELGKTKEALEDTEALIAGLKARRTETEKEYREKQKEVIQAKAILVSLKNMAEKYDGYGNSVKRIMEHKKEEAGIIGVVADIIKVKESYELAIETAMGGSIQNIVTDKEETAKRTIAWLKANRYGRATFLPLDAIGLHNPGNFGGALNEKGIIGPASSLVEYEPRFAGVVSHILGRTLVAENMDTATRIARKYRYALRIVTPEGEQLNPGGAISGGAFKNTMNLLGRAREIEEKTEALHRLEEELKATSEKGKEISEQIEENKKKALLLRAGISEYRIAIQTEQNGRKQLTERLFENEKALSEIRLDADRNEKEKEFADREILRLREILNDKEGDSSGLSEVDREMKRVEERMAELTEESGRIRLELTEIRAELSFLDTDLGRIEERKEMAEAEMKKLHENHLNFASLLSEKNREVETIGVRIAEIASCIRRVEQEREVAVKEREELSRVHKKIFEEREEVAETKSGLEKEIMRTNSLLEKTEAELEALVEYMAEEYGLTYSELIKTYHVETEYSRASLKKMIGGLKQRIRELGNVNVNAIEEYREVGERYELLKVQHDDIVKAEETLRTVIDELDKRMREQFDERFRDINESFNKAFGELFGGGRGRLELTDGEDILEAGIKIIAQPPGKKLQNMMQLSGGEKSLTAIALLFAIQNLKPSPFCLLDEIEAALDDSNVVRFAEYLHKLTQNTQFIVITHRRGTMNAADVLYGITMQEKGISTMVSVNLIEAELSN